MKESRLYYLFERYLNGTSTASENIELSTYILAPEHAEAIERLKEEFWEKTEGEPMENAEVEKYLQLILQPPARKTSFFLWKRIAVAASLIFAISTASYFIFFHKQAKKEELAKVESKDIEAPKQSRAMITLANGRTISIDSFTSLTQSNVSLIKTADGKIVYSGKSGKVVYNTLSNPRGSKVIDMQLADGSHIWLNAGSSVTYPVAFIGNDRKVSVTGEAYFEVSHDVRKPFYVTKGDMTVQVLGTHFNVNTYDDESDSKVTLIEGSVKVNKGAAEDFLRPGQQAQVTSTIKVINNVDIDAVMAWKNGKFILDGVDLKILMRQVARWYDVDIVYKNTVIEKEFDGTIGRNVSLSSLLEGLQENGVKCRLDGRTVIMGD